MESVGVFPDGEWDSFGSIFDTDQVDLLTRYLGNSPLPENYDAGGNSAWQTFFDPPASIGINGINKSWSHSLDALAADFNPRKHDYRHSSYHTSQPNDISVFIDMNSMGVKKNSSLLPSLTENLDEDHRRAPYSGGGIGSHGCENSDYNLPTTMAIKSSNEEEKLKRKLNCKVQNTQLPYNRRKKNGVSQHSAVESPNSTYKSVKNSSKTSVREDGNGGSEGQSSSGNSSDDENASPDNNGGSTSSSKTGKLLISKEKARAARGSATDPQSIYARKRREKINERLRILQKLVPNGTKVDISTMLEEAVHYVKFLQLQIKLLSSDDHWMYAPIAYNGMDIGLHQKIINPLLFP